MDGAAVLREWREEPGTASVPVAVLSADATGSRRNELLAAAAIRYLTKPYRVAEISRAVREMLADRPLPGTVAPWPLQPAVPAQHPALGQPIVPAPPSGAETATSAPPPAPPRPGAAQVSGS